MIREAPAVISTISAAEIEQRLAELAALLHACVHAGASIGFVLPFTEADAAGFWRDRVLPPISAGGRTMLVAEIDGRIAGTVQLGHDTPANQPHRAEVTKLLVHPDYRRRGIARALMAALERHALGFGRRLLTLDTRTGDMAELLYAALGFTGVGVIPGYCLDPEGGRLDSTTIMYKEIGGVAAS